MRPLAVYLHIPFCTVKCGYCDFNAYAGMDRLKDQYARALVEELRRWQEHLGPREIRSVFLGGGTPGEMTPAQIAGFIESVRGLGPFVDGCEVTLEANPATVLEQHLPELLAAGITRLSLGAQSFHPHELQFLDRIHSPQAAAACARTAKAGGFASVSMDLIYGLPGQDPATFMASLEQALAVGSDHLSLYALTIEPGTPLAARVDRGEVELADPDVVAEMYDLASERLERAGFEHYEISNWAKPGHRSRHNLAYWTDAEYLGAGAGAHGYLGGERYDNIAHPRQYIAALSSEAVGLPIEHAYLPNLPMRLVDWLETGLRRLEGFTFAGFEAAFGMPFPASLGVELAPMVTEGLVVRDETGMRLAERGLLLQNEIVATVLPAIERAYGAMAELPAPNLDSWRGSRLVTL